MQSLIQCAFPLFRSIIIRLKTIFTAYVFRFLLTVRHSCSFSPTKVLFYVWKFEYRPIIYIYISASFSETLLGAEHRHENLLRKSPLELCSYRFCSNHSQETPSCIPTRRAPRIPKLKKVVHNKPIAIGLMIMAVQCTWYEERLYVDLYTSFC